MSIRICEDTQHDEIIVFDSNECRDCPLCTALERIVELETDIEDLKAEMKNG